MGHSHEQTQATANRRSKTDPPTVWLVRERLDPLDITADAVTLTYLPVTVFYPMYPCGRPSVVVPSIWWLTAAPTREECKYVYSLIVRALCAPVGLQVRDNLRWCQCQTSFISVFCRKLGSRKPEIQHARAHCMDAAASRYSIIAVTEQYFS